MPLPEDDARAPGRLGVDAAPGFVGIPQHHLVERHAHLVGGVPAQMLIGEEEHTPPALPGPAQRRRRVRRGADDATVLAAEGFDARGRIDVRDRNDRCLGPGCVGRVRWTRRGLTDDAHLLQIRPAHQKLIGLRHVGHGASGGEIGQDHLLMRRAQHVRAFGHEVHAAEHDELRVGVLAHLPGELVGVAGVVGELDHLVALIVVAQDDEPSAERRTGRSDARIHLLVRQPDVLLGQRLTFGDVRLLVGGQERNLHHNHFLIWSFGYLVIFPFQPPNDQMTK